MKKKVIRILLIIAIILLNISSSYASGLSEIYNIGDNNALSNAGATIAGYIRYGVIIAAVIMLMVKGIKFITSAPEGKAEAKKELMPWAIGVVILFSMNFILNFIVDFSQKHVNNMTI